MSFSRFLRTTGLAALTILPVAALAGEIVVSDPYARTSRPNAPTGAAFMMIANTGTEDDRLIAVRSTVAKRIELHTHIDKGDGVMQMTEIEGGISLPAGETTILQRGGDHVMFMGLTQALKQGETISVVFDFEKSPDLTLTIPVDNERKPRHGAMKHGNMDNGMSN